jgi:hypothetical protein
MRLSIGGRDLSLQGVVVYSDPGHGVGVRFHDLSDEDETLLRNELGLN